MQTIKKIYHKILPVSLLNYLFRIKTALLSIKEIRITENCSQNLSLKNKKSKIELVFIIYMPEVFSSFQSIYESACKNSNFSVHILAQPHVDNQQGLKGQNPAYDYLRNKYDNVINAYDNNEWFDLKKLNPDYVFYTRPYNHQYYNDYLPSVVRYYAKVCFEQYSYDMDITADFYIVYNYPFIQNVTFVFNSAESICNKVKKMIKNHKKYPQALCFGFTRFDLLKNYSKQDKKRKTVLWLPRWTASKKQGKRQGHFFEYINLFLSFAENNKDIDFIIRPHPLMFANFKLLGLYTEKDIENLYKKCNEIGNVFIDTDKSYLESLLKADILFADYTALLVEYFMTGNPIIYCDDASTFSKEVKQMDKGFYHEKSWFNIKDRLEKLLRNKDELFDDRKKIISKFIGETLAGEKIIKYLQNDYYGVKE